MGRREDIQDHINELQAQLDILNSAPEDTYSFGTVAVFAAATGDKWYYVKIAEESWSKLKRSSASTEIARALSEWILHAVNSNIGYFEVYILTVEETPIYASA